MKNTTMGEFEPFDVPSSTKNFIFPMASYETPGLLFFCIYITHFLRNHLLFINNPTKPSLEEML